MSAHDEGTEGSSSMSRPSSVDPNAYVLSEAIRSSMENSMELLSATMQRNALVMASTIREGFAARPSIEGSRDTLSKKRARTSSQVARDDSSGSSHKRSRNMAREACTAQVVVASPSHSEGDGAADVVSLLDASDSFSDQDQPVATSSTLDRALADFEVEETTGPHLSEAMALRVCHILKTPLLSEKLKVRMDRELCPSNTPLISAKKVNQSLFNKREGPMATIRGHDLQLQSVQKIMTKAMLPLVRLADSFLLAELETPAMPSPTEALNARVDSFSLRANANLQMDQMRREGFKAALPTRYKGLVNVPDPLTELLFGDLDTRMKDLNEKAKLEDTLQSAPPPKFAKVSVHPSAGKTYVPRASPRANSRFPSSSLASKKLASFPHNGQLVNDFGETTQKQEVARQKVNTFLFPPLVVDQLAGVSRCYETWADIPNC